MLPPALCLLQVAAHQDVPDAGQAAETRRGQEPTRRVPRTELTAVVAAVVARHRRRLLSMVLKYKSLLLQKQAQQRRWTPHQAHGLQQAMPRGGCCGGCWRRTWVSSQPPSQPQAQPRHQPAPAIAQHRPARQATDSLRSRNEPRHHAGTEGSCSRSSSSSNNSNG